MSTIWAIGASVRALTQSLAASGHRVIAADLFNDLDLQRFAVQTQQIERYPHDLLRLVDQVEADAFTYTGGLENEPDLIDQLAQRLPLIGNPGPILRRVRNPVLLNETLARAGFHMPSMATHVPDGATGAWLRKSAASSGGLRVNWSHPDDSLGPGEYFQAFVAGEVFGASFHGSKEGVELLCITRQLGDCPWTRAPRFHYAGSIGPSNLSARLQSEVERLGQFLGTEYALRGWFGVDFVVDSRETINVLEVNPRYTASMELLGAQRAPVVAKAILYAEQRAVVTPEFSLLLIERDDVADVPRPGSIIAAGSPVCSLFACGSSEPSVLAKLQAKSGKLAADLVDLPAAAGARG